MRPARTLLLASAALLGAWTLYWTVQGVGGLLSDTALGRGEMGDSLAYHHLWELLFVGAFYAIRWAAGALILGFPLLSVPVLALRDRIRRSRRAALSS
ncbi:MAG: hypothetical protein JSU98_09515 [Gemmatimonadales bacterium]|jgi:hypothetical protein|nr:MAG: hypothetical protein JSU98_09515 [Gemmatimonadales bacterium]